MKTSPTVSFSAPRRDLRSVRTGLVGAQPLFVVLLWLIACGGEVPPVEKADGALPLTDLFAIADHEGQMAEYQLGTPSARVALRDGWAPDEKREGDGRPFAWGLGAHSDLTFFANQQVDFTLIFEGKAITFPGASDQVVTVEINGREVGQVVIGNLLGERRLPVSGEQLKVGENRLTLYYSHHRRPHDIDPDSLDERPLAVQWFSIRFSGLGGDGQVRLESEAEEQLVIPLGHRIRFFFDTSDQSALLLPRLVGHDHALPLRLHADVETAGGAEEQRIWPVDPQTSVRLELPPDRLVRLTLSVTRDPDRESSWWDRLMKREQLDEVVLPGAALTALQDTSAPAVEHDEEPERLPNILVYLIDTLRADHLGAYGYDRPTSPRIDAFAEESVLFTKAQAQTSWTRTAVVSLFTGLNPQSHRVNGRLDVLPESIDTLAEHLHRAGYQTGAIITNGNIEHSFGIGQGFEFYDRLLESKQRPEIHKLSDRLNAETFHWLEKQRDSKRPFFLYLHATDPHAPYMPPEPFRSRFAAGVDPEVGSIDVLRDIFQNKAEPPPGFRQDAIDLYDAEIAFNDHHFGRLLDHLRDLGLYDDLLIVLVSDHGEEFFDHGSWEHGRTLYGEQLNVPLVVKLPGGEGAGQRLGTVARQVDLLPTVLDYLGLPSPKIHDGRSLLPAIRGAEADTVRPVSYSLVALDHREIEAALARGWKLIENRSRGESTHELFDLQQDAEEQVDAYTEHEFEGQFLHQALRLGHWVQRQRSLALPGQAEITGELEERLRALGYLN